jgi:hypothetical protein
MDRGRHTGVWGNAGPRTLLLCVCIVLFGCAAPGISTSSLTPAQSGEILILKNGYTYSKTSPFGAISTFSLVAGEYRAEYRGLGGTFFRGKGYPMKYTIVDRRRKVVQSQEGGIFLPERKASAAKIYVYAGAYSQLKVYDSISGAEEPLDYTSDGKSPGLSARDSSVNTSSANSAPDSGDYKLVKAASDLVTPPVPTPKQSIDAGVGAALGVTIAQSLSSDPKAGDIVFLKGQPEDDSLRFAVER